MPVPPGAFGPGSERPFAQYFEGESSVRVASIEEIVAWLQTCEYVSDVELFRKRDVWQHPSAFEHLRRGDCEDFALWAWRKLGELGIDADFCVGRVDLDRSAGHRLSARLGGLSHRRNGVSPGARRTDAGADDPSARGRDGPVRAALRREPSIRDPRVRRLRGRIAAHRREPRRSGSRRPEARTDRVARESRGEGRPEILRCRVQPADHGAVTGTRVPQVPRHAGSVPAVDPRSAQGARLRAP